MLVAAAILVALASALALTDSKLHAGRLTDEDCRALTARARPALLASIARRQTRGSYAVLPFIWPWLQICAAVLAVSAAQSWILAVLATLFIAGRFRALQEVSHFAIHGALGLPRSSSHRLADLAFQFPLGKPCSRARHLRHVQQHHHNRNSLDADPNVAEIVGAGIHPGCGYWALASGALHPLQPAGLLGAACEAFLLVVQSAREHRIAEPSLRLVFATGIPCLCYWLAGPMGIICFWVVPRFALYPLMAWWSQLLEHLWFKSPTQTPEFSAELAHGRATAYHSLSGAMIRFFVLPFGDSYHLAHSIYPFLRYNYLPIIDRRLRQDVEDYENSSTVGLSGTEGKSGSLSHLVSIACARDWSEPMPLGDVRSVISRR